MSTATLGALAAHFGRDVERGVSKAVGIVEAAARDGVDLLVFPDATLGGYLGDLRNPDPDELPPALDPDGPELAAIIAAAGDTTVCIGYTEAGGDKHFNTAVCVSGDGILGSHRKVHQPAGESLAYAAGDEFRAFDTPVGRIGMLIDYDKTFPESARTLALDGARIIAALSAWPASVTDRAARLPADRQSRLFDLYDCARAAENQVFVVSSNQTGVMGSLRFLGQAKVVGPGGDILATTRSKGGLAGVTVDVDAEIDRARRVLSHLAELRPDTYRSVRPQAGSIADLS
ncbi:carbon-nitrogen hydrolase family protein [Gordonia rubripertincta]|uniref:Carbon-nitrogen hydrolase family protein n=2 Tax=Gordonia rubripertincta TaxID=36822 RepID=A0AAW6R7W3_GORRU|nr:carbon-nitrogen hydrolase family protein [Gordonia rubripertincta]MDG6781544.1 carbon-nitrogen hydrolase family protein [Gordonia rubripertincta]NKY61416.1 carbon-nitrogen hydrolase family protein [Gordonia rubripertincta]NKY61683.1 carbon-nitrogen hydrolase family protein [Gordonia rubripertincta]GAB83971.1 putative carbon-nitrogen hydrolase [Gordonia rubripertincta NBRC 101908]